ncbi:hypothetical protein [Calothrix sp. CCY 0018]|uniref:COG1470 family protein n=1 Tax=Calothrix sp. CCY 0018 TaxID=3103864 RepID=UPI0039C61E6A
MQAKSNPLFVIINPPGIQYGMPGETVKINIVVINEGQQSAVIDLFFTFDETFEKISNWSSSPRASLAIAPGESSDEVTFELEIPIDALPGTYDYTFVVDSPEHYPQDTPINFPGQIKVLLKEQTVIRANDPTFSIQPATNPSKPLIYKPNQLQVTVKVENRSTRVDRFYLTCPELDEEWLRISYPETGVEAAGLVEVSALELNPISEGQILLEFRPPINTLAGNYSPTIRLHSENNPDLILLDLVYIQIPTDYQLNIELNTILGKVSRKLGKYQLRLNNQGNLVRELHLSARSRDEEELCIYQFEPTEVKLLPSKSAEANLTVKPRPWWRRPWRGQPLIINFQVDVHDKQELPIPSKLPQAVLEWKPRPFWQLLLLILVGLGLTATVTFLIWKYLYPEPLKIEEFRAENRTLIEGDEVRLSWKIANYKQLKSLAIATTQPPSNKLILNKNISELIKVNQNGNPLCRVTSQEELVCNRLKTGITAKEKYVFEIKASYPQRQSLFSQRIQNAILITNVEIREKPIAEIADLKTDKIKYQKGENVILSWTVNRPELLDKIEIITKVDEKTQVGQPKSFKFKSSTFDDPKLKDNCEKQGKQTKCKISLPAINIGNFIYELKAYTQNVNDRISTKNIENTIEVIAKPFKIVFFKINGSEQLNQVLNEGEKAILTWKVEGEDIQVELLPYQYKVPLVGTKELDTIKNFPSPITLSVTDKYGTREAQRKSFAISVKEKPPTPNPFISPFNPASPVRLRKNKS